MNSTDLKQKYRRRSNTPLIILSALCILFLNGASCVEVADSKQGVSEEEDDGEYQKVCVSYC